MTQRLVIHDHLRLGLEITVSQRSTYSLVNKGKRTAEPLFRPSLKLTEAPIYIPILLSYSIYSLETRTQTRWNRRRHHTGKAVASPQAKVSRAKATGLEALLLGAEPL